MALKSAPKFHAHVSFGDLVSILKKLPKDALLHAESKNYYPELSLHSYRAHYEDFEFDITEVPVTVGEFLEMLIDCKGKMLPSYRGGNYEVTDETYLWMGKAGAVFNCALHGVFVNADDSYTLTGLYI